MLGATALRWVPAVGPLALFLEDRLAFMEGCARQGDARIVRLGPFRALVLGHPEYVRQVFLREGVALARGISGAPMRAFLGRGLLLSEGEEWKRQRRAIQPLFAAERVSAWRDEIERSVDSLVARWRDGEVRDIHAEMHRLTLDVAARLFLGLAADGRGALHPSLEAVLARDVFDLRVPIGPLRWPPRTNASARAFDALVRSCIADHRGGLIPELAAACADTRELRDQLVTLVFTAQDTTAVALTWLWHLLALAPRAEDELRAALGGAGADAVVGRLMDETLRLYPPVVGQARQAVAACVIAERPVQRGDLVLFSQWVIQRDPRWFEDALAFRPERWRDGLADRLHPFAYFPFGGGRRVCVGRSLARLIAEVCVPAIARCYRLRATSELRPMLDTHITPRPRGGMPMRLAAA